ncbi:MAG: glycosyltransferase family 2 protein [Lachnospiraceae bacterium]|nr:glycosyltransferase family 2 protein [Lachnospiraceae bacterium]
MILYLVIPCYNEEEVLPETAGRLKEKIQNLISQGRITEKSRVVFVDDGSKDQTWKLIEELHKQNTLFSGVKLSRNRGHQNALMAGLYNVRGKADAVISLDADLQDDINAIDGFLDQYNEGCEVVYGVRSSRKKDSFFKKFTAEMFYKMMNLMGAEVVFNHADYRLLSSRALDALFEFKEVNLFLRGIVPMVGFRSGEVYYERNERFAGESKYPLKKMLSFAFEGITSLSIKPIRFIINMGIFMFFVSMLMLLYFLIRHFTGHTVSGWTSLIVSIWAIGGLQLLSIGVIGEYIGKVYLETKQRPRFIIDEFLHEQE